MLKHGDRTFMAVAGIFHPISITKNIYIYILKKYVQDFISRKHMAL